MDEKQEIEAWEAWVSKRSEHLRTHHNENIYRAGYKAGQEARAALAAQGVPTDLCERICAAIKAAVDKSTNEAEYMIDSYECIAIVRKQFAAAPAPEAPKAAPCNVCGGSKTVEQFTSAAAPVQKVRCFACGGTGKRTFNCFADKNPEAEWIRAEQQEQAAPAPEATGVPMLQCQLAESLAYWVPEVLPRTEVESRYRLEYHLAHGFLAQHEKEVAKVGKVSEATREHFAPAQAQQVVTALASAWADGYQLGVLDERTSESNIGVAGFGAKVEPARQNPYGDTPAEAQQAEVEPLTDEIVSDRAREMVKGSKSVNWLIRTLERDCAEKWGVKLAGTSTGESSNG